MIRTKSEETKKKYSAVSGKNNTPVCWMGNVVVRAGPVAFMGMEHKCVCVCVFVRRENSGYRMLFTSLWLFSHRFSFLSPLLSGGNFFLSEPKNKSFFCSSTIWEKKIPEVECKIQRGSNDVWILYIIFINAHGSNVRWYSRTKYWIFGVLERNRWSGCWFEHTFFRQWLRELIPLRVGIEWALHVKQYDTFDAAGFTVWQLKNWPERQSEIGYSWVWCCPGLGKSSSLNEDIMDFIYPASFYFFRFTFNNFEDKKDLLL